MICWGCVQGPGAAPGEMMQARIEASPGFAVGARGMVTVATNVPLGGVWAGGGR